VDFKIRYETVNGIENLLKMALAPVWTHVFSVAADKTIESHKIARG
jgi:hypothetical protein